MAEVASAYVSLLPSAKGFGSKLNHSIGGDVAKQGSVMGRSFGKLFALGAGVLAGAGIIRSVKGFIKEANENRKVLALTSQVIKSTGSAANVTADYVGKLSEKLALQDGVSDEAAQSAANMVLTFKNIKNTGSDKMFDKTTSAVLDMSKAMGQDTRSSAIMLGKALNDPARGVTALTRVGVTFTNQQRDQIAAMVKAGNIAGAQGMILKEVGSEFGGAAAAMATPGERLKTIWGRLQVTLGKLLLPAVDAVLTGFVNVTAWINEHIGPALEKFSGRVKSVSTVLGGGLRKAIDTIGNSIKSGDGFVSGLIQALSNMVSGGIAWLSGGGLQTIFAKITAARQQFLDAILAAVPGLVDGLIQIVPMLVQAVSQLISQIVSFVTSSLPSLIAAGVKLFSGLIQGSIQILPQLAGAILKLLPLIVNAIVSMLPGLVAAAIRLFSSLVTAVVAIVPKLISAIVALLPKIISLIVAMLPILLNASIRLFTALVDALPKILPKLVTGVISLLPPIIKAVLTMLPELILAAVKLFTALLLAIPKVINPLINAVTDMLPFIVKTLIAMIPQLIVAGVKLFIALVPAVVKAIPQIIVAFASLGVQLIKAVLGLVPKMFKVGVQIINGLLNGIKSLAGSIGRFFLSILPGWIRLPFEKALGIHSPSRVFFANGVNIVKGLINGVSAMAPAATKRSKALADSLSKTVSDVISRIGQQAASPAFNVADIGIARVNAQIRASATALTAAINRGLSAADAKPLAKQIMDAAKLAQSQLKNLRAQINTTDLKNLSKSLTGSVDDMHAAFGQLLTDMKRAGAAPQIIRALTVQEKALTRAMTAQATITDKLSAAQDNLNSLMDSYQQQIASVTSAIQDYANIATMGIVGSGDQQSVSLQAMIDQYTQAANVAQTFTDSIASLKSRGLDSGIINQLIAAGPGQSAQQVQALMGASAAQIAQINSVASRVLSTGGQLGTLSANNMYSQGIASAQALISGLQSQQSALTRVISTLSKNTEVLTVKGMKAQGAAAADGLIKGLQSKQGALISSITAIGKAMLAAFKKTLDIHSPSKVMAKQVGLPMVQGIGVGMLSGQAALTDTASRVAQAAIPPVPALTRQTGTLGSSNVNALLMAVTALGKIMRESSQQNAAAIGGAMAETERARQDFTRKRLGGAGI